MTPSLSGYRTYIVAALAIIYLIWCQTQGRQPDDTIIGIFGALGLASLRAGLKGAVIQALNQEIDQPAAPQLDPPASAPSPNRNGSGNGNGNGSLRGGIPALALALISFGLILGGGSGCTTRTIEFGGAKYTSRRLGVAEQFGKIELHAGTNSMSVDGVQSDLVTGIKVGVETALKAAATLRP